MTGGWLEGAQRACNDAVSRLSVSATADQLIELAKAQALIDQAYSLRVLVEAVTADNDDEGVAGD